MRPTRGATGWVGGPVVGVVRDTPFPAPPGSPARRGHETVFLLPAPDRAVSRRASAFFRPPAVFASMIFGRSRGRTGGA